MTNDLPTRQTLLYIVDSVTDAASYYNGARYDRAIKRLENAKDLIDNCIEKLENEADKK